MNYTESVNSTGVTDDGGDCSRSSDCVNENILFVIMILLNLFKKAKPEDINILNAFFIKKGDPFVYSDYEKKGYIPLKLETYEELNEFIFYLQHANFSKDFKQLLINSKINLLMRVKDPLSSSAETSGGRKKIYSKRKSKSKSKSKSKRKSKRKSKGKFKRKSKGKSKRKSKRKS